MNKQDERKSIYVTSECCGCRRAVFSSPDIRKSGDYDRWPYGIRETRLIAHGTHETVRRAGAGRDLYLMRTARAVLDILGAD